MPGPYDTDEVDVDVFNDPPPQPVLIDNINTHDYGRLHHNQVFDAAHGEDALRPQKSTSYSGGEPLRSKIAPVGRDFSPYGYAHPTLQSIPSGDLRFPEEAVLGASLYDTPLKTGESELLETNLEAPPFHGGSVPDAIVEAARAADRTLTDFVLRLVLEDDPTMSAHAQAQRSIQGSFVDQMATNAGYDLSHGPDQTDMFAVLANPDTGKPVENVPVGDLDQDLLNPASVARELTGHMRTPELGEDDGDTDEEDDSDDEDDLDEEEDDEEEDEYGDEDEDES